MTPLPWLKHLFLVWLIQMPPPSASNVTQGSSKLVPVNGDANDLASMVDTIYAASEPSSDSSSKSSDLEDPPDDSSEDPPEHHSDATPVAPPDDMEMELPEEDLDPVMDDAHMPNSSTLPLLSVGDQQQTLGTGPSMPPTESSTTGPALADLGRWA